MKKQMVEAKKSMLLELIKHMDGVTKGKLKSKKKSLPEKVDAELDMDGDEDDEDKKKKL